jgi:sugar/nucleoside kinase (ribokinase family)
VNVGFVTAAQNFDVVSLGDVVTDEFIRLPPGPVHVRTDEHGQWLEIPLGTKLAVDDDAPANTGGSAANAAVALSRLGLRVGLASYLAHDQVGLDVLSALRAQDVDTRLIHVDVPTHTVRNFVLSFGGERTILVRHAAFTYHWTGLRDVEVPTWLSVNSLGPDALDYQDQIADWLDDHPRVHVAFQPGTFQIEAGASRLARLYARSEVLLCRRSGAESLAGAPGAEASTLLDALTQLGPRQVVVFEPGGGAFAANGQGRWRIDPLTAPDPPRDRTGMGDAFAATALAALVYGQSLPEALRWGLINALATSRELGAQAGLLRHDELVAQLDDAVPADMVHELGA